LERTEQSEGRRDSCEILKSFMEKLGKEARKIL
jgi:hypothetical protein